MSGRFVIRGLCCAVALILSCEESGKKAHSETELQGVAGNGGNAGEAGAGGAAGAATAGAAGKSPFEKPSELELKFVPIPLGVGQTTDFDFVPGTSNEILALSHPGAVRHVRITNETVEALGSADIPGVFYEEGCGLLSLAFDPEFAKNRYLFMGRCVDTQTSKLARYRFDDLTKLASSEVEIMTLKADKPPAEDWHRWGSLGFEPDGTMWALLGDLFVRGDSQDVTKKPGSLLRFIPNRVEGESGYVPAAGNAFSDETKGDLSVYAYGFRSPWRGVRDKNGRFFVGDVGEYKREELDLVSKAGQNFGWDKHEGACSTDCGNLINPVVSWGRTSDDPYAVEDPDTEPNTRRAAWVGAVYDQPSMDRYYGFMDGFVMYGDFYTGWVRGLKLAADDKVETDRLLGHLTQVTSGRVGPDGFIYLLTLGGTLYRVEQVLD